MKRLLLAVPLLLLAGQAQAQGPVGPETYDQSATLAQARRVDIGRVVHNEQTCFAAGLALDCTEAQVRAVPGHEADRIYADSRDGRDAFLAEVWIIPDFQSVLNEQKRWDTQKAKINWDAKTRQDKDTICGLLSLAAGCEIY